MVFVLNNFIGIGERRLQRAERLHCALTIRQVAAQTRGQFGTAFLKESYHLFQPGQIAYRQCVVGVQSLLKQTVNAAIEVDPGLVGAGLVE